MFKMILKFGFAGAIIYWLIQKGHLDFSLLVKCLDHKIYWFSGIALVLVHIFITSIRWKLLLEIKTEKKIAIPKILNLTWIGLFFSSVLPGAVTGDLIKLVYALDLDKNLSKTFLVTSVFMDRVIGLLGLLTLLGISSLVFYSELVNTSPEVAHLIHINFLLFLATILALTLLFLPNSYQMKVIRLFQNIPLIGSKMIHILKQFWLFGENRKVIFINLLLSIFTQTISIFAFWLMVMPFFTIALPFKFALSFIPVGFITVAIPISPAGLGVGHAAFATLFNFYGEPNGASLFNIYFITYVCINLLGFIPYVLSGKKHHLDEVKEFEEIEANP